MRVFMIDRSFLCAVAVVTLLCDFAVCVWCVFFFKLVEWQYLSPGRTLSLGPLCARQCIPRIRQICRRERFNISIVCVSLGDGLATCRMLLERRAVCNVGISLNAITAGTHSQRVQPPTHYGAHLPRFHSLPALGKLRTV